MDTTPEYLKSIYQMAPALPEIKRNSKSLYDQFVYRFNHSPEHGVMYAVVQFGQQWIFQLIAVSRQMDAKLIAISNDNGISGPLSFRHECFLSAPGIPACGGCQPYRIENIDLAKSAPRDYLIR